MTTGLPVKAYIAADTGAVDHVAGLKDIPDSVEVQEPDDGKSRNFVGPKGESIDHYGTSEVKLVDVNGQAISNNFQVADVCRPLHSVSKITDNGHDMVFTKKCGYVIPEGLLDELLAIITPVTTYPRKGGLYVAEMLIVDPKTLAPKTPGSSPGALGSSPGALGSRAKSKSNEDPGKTSSFARPVAGR